MNVEDDSQPRDGEHAPSDGNEEITTTPQEAEQNEELPQEPLEDFAWDELESRYRTMMQTKDDEILEVAKEYEALADFFTAWVEAGQNVENERAHKRHKTQETYVGKEEQDVEKLRSHYVGVMTAFENAMKMLS
ncbi:hypothetical protein C1H76_4104 [Elsinoe australis]|uniref:Uncharacterized protein n=1 Tax=Elsinoe australis TaxID=40998 RepID=A0A4V6DVF3_9PEZI|nr:hypothetical protein C1H76_4104 [Elsinoe australis]